MMIDKIIDINYNIDDWYRKSKLPKPIKVFVAKNRRRKLKRCIKRYTSVKYKVDDIFEFMYYCLRFNPPNGQFMDVVKIKEVDYEKKQPQIVFIANVRFGKPNTQIIYNYDIKVSNRNAFELDFKVISPEGNRKMISGNKDLLELDYDRADNEVSLCMKLFNSELGEMIGSMLTDVLKRSERIYEI